MTNFAVASSVDNSSGSANGGQVLVNVQPQNGAVRIQYIQVQNQLPGAVSTGTVVQNIGAVQLPMNSLKQGPLQQQGQQLVTHGVQGGMNLQGTIIPTSAGNHIVIRTVNQTSSDVSAGHVDMQPIQIGGSNFVGGMQVTQQVTSVQQGVRLQQPQVTTFVSRTNAVTGQVIDASTGLSGGRHIVLQRTPGVASQHLVIQQMPQQQQAVTLPVDATGSQDNKHSDGLVVQIGGQTYRLEPSHQPLGAANVRQNSIFPQSQSVGFGDGSGVGVSQDPVKMLKQNVQLQQMLIGNQINVLQMLQKQQQQQQSLQPMFAVQQFSAGSSGTNPTNVTSGSGGTVLHRAVDVSQPLQAPNTLEKTSSDTSLWGLGPSMTIAPTPQSGLQFIQPKPVVSVGIPDSSGIVGQPLNVLPLVQPGAQPTLSSANRNIVGANTQPSAQVVTTLSGSQLNLKPGMDIFNTVKPFLYNTFYLRFFAKCIKCNFL